MWRTPALTRASPARPRSAGKKQSFEGVEYTIQELTKNRRATQLCSASRRGGPTRRVCAQFP